MSTNIYIPLRFIGDNLRHHYPHENDNDNDDDDALDTRIQTSRRKIIIFISISVAIIIITILPLIIIFVSVKKNHSSSSSLSTALPVTANNSTFLNGNNISNIISTKQEVTSGEIDWKQLIATVANKFYDLYQWNDYKQIPLHNKTCTVQVKGRIHKLSWVWDGRFECDGVVGESRHYENKDGAAGNAVQDYLIKSKQVGLIKNEQLQQIG